MTLYMLGKLTFPRVLRPDAGNPVMATRMRLILFLLIILCACGCAGRQNDEERFINLLRAKISATGNVSDNETPDISRLYDALVRDKKHAPFVLLLTDTVSARRTIGIYGLRDIGDDRAFKLISLFLGDPDPKVRCAAADAMSHCRDTQYVKRLLPLLDDRERVPSLNVPHPYANPMRGGGGPIQSVTHNTLKKMTGEDVAFGKWKEWASKNVK